MRARLIANPHSGADRAPSSLPLINEKLRSIVDELDITLTTRAEDAERTAARALAEGCDALYVAGGDGTLNAVLRGLMSFDEAAPGIPVGIIPFGTGNDFAKALGLGDQPEPALDLLLERRVTSVDVGLLNGRPFVNTSAGGFIADVSDAVSEELKDVTGRLAYIIGGARVLFGSEPFSARLTLCGGAPPPWDGWLELQMFAVCNARFIGGGYEIAPDARIDDGLLDVLMIPRMPMLDFVATLQRIASGDHDAIVDAVRFKAAAFDLEFNRSVRVNTDGEVLEAERSAYRLHPQRARFFCGPELG